MKNRQTYFDFNFAFLILTFLLATVFFSYRALSAEVKTLKLSDDTVAQVRISARGTVLSFPVKPTKVILGKTGSFGIEYVENDLAISPLSTSAQSNLFVYLLGRRFSFDLTTSPTEGSAVILVRDASDFQTDVTQLKGKKK